LGGIGSCLDNSSLEGGGPVALSRSPLDILRDLQCEVLKNLQSRL
jgi:hypothetical protein